MADGERLEGGKVWQDAQGGKAGNMDFVKEKYLTANADADTLSGMQSAGRVNGCKQGGNRVTKRNITPRYGAFYV